MSNGEEGWKDLPITKQVQRAYKQTEKTMGKKSEEEDTCFIPIVRAYKEYYKIDGSNLVTYFWPPSKTPQFGGNQNQVAG